MKAWFVAALPGLMILFFFFGFWVGAWAVREKAKIQAYEDWKNAAHDTQVARILAKHR